MKSHRLLARTLLAILITAVLVVHAYFLCRIASHMAFAVVALLLVILLIKHIGLFGSIYAAVRHRTRLRQ